MIAIRWLISVGLAAAITLSLFYFMQALIKTGATLEQNPNIVRICGCNHAGNRHGSDP